MKSFLSYKQTPSYVMGLVALLAMISSTNTQTSGSSGSNGASAYRNPHVAVNCTSIGTPKLFPILQKLQYDLLKINLNLPNSIASAVPATYAMAGATAPIDAITQVIAFLNYVVNTTEPLFQNYTILTSNIPKYHLNQFSIFSSMFDQALNWLQSLNSTVNNDCNLGYLNMAQISNNMPSYLANFNSSILAATPVQVSILNAFNNFPILAGPILISQNQTLNNAKANLINSRNISIQTFNNIKTNQTNVFLALNISINQTQNFYNAVWRNFTGHGAVCINNVRIQYNNTCAPVEGILLQSVAQGQYFLNTSIGSAIGNMNATQVAVNQFQANLTSYYNNIYWRYVNSSALANNLTAVHQTPINSIQVDFIATNNLINNYIQNIWGFINVENSYVNQKTSSSWALPSLNSYLNFIQNAQQIDNGLTSIIDIGNVNIQNLVFNNTPFSLVSSVNPSSYNLLFSLPVPVPPAPANQVLPSSIPQAPIIAPKPTINAPPTYITNYPGPSIPAILPGIGATSFAPPSYNLQSPYPNLFTYPGAYDQSISTTNLLPASFPCGANWFELFIDLSRYFLPKIPSALVTVTATQLPNAPILLQIPLIASVPNPNANNPLATVNPNPNPSPAPGAPINNGWNNFILSWTIIKTQLNVKVRVLVTDPGIAMSAGLVAAITIVPS